MALKRVINVSGRWAWLGLTASGRATYDRALDALALMRSEGLSLRQAAKKAHTTPGVVRKYVGSALRSTRAGTIPMFADRFYRRMTVIAADGPVTVEVRGSRAASLVGRHANAVQQFIVTHDPSVLREFSGKSVGGHRLATEPNMLKQFARRGQLDFEDLYDLTM